MTAKKNGRPPAMTPIRRAIILATLAAGAPRWAAAKLANLSDATLRTYEKNEPEFALQIVAAIRDAFVPQMYLDKFPDECKEARNWQIRVDSAAMERRKSLENKYRTIQIVNEELNSADHAFVRAKICDRVEKLFKE